MTGAEMLEEMNKDGREARTLYHFKLDGYFSWDVGFENGDAVLTVRFEDPEAPILNSEKKWKLTPVEVQGSGKRS